MIITLETVIENLFLASIILMAFSIPKMILLLIWSRYRVYVFSGGFLKFISYKRFKLILEKHIPRAAIEKYKDEESVFNQVIKENENLLIEMKIPFIEAFSSIVLMIFCLFNLDFQSEARIFIIIIVTLITIVFFVILIVLIIISRFLTKATPIIDSQIEKQSKNEKIN